MTKDEVEEVLDCHYHEYFFSREEPHNPITFGETTTGKHIGASGHIVARHRDSHVATWVDIDRLSPSVLRHLAAAKKRRSRLRHDDADAVGEELAAMLMAGTPHDRLVPTAPDRTASTI